MDLYIDKAVETEKGFNKKSLDTAIKFFKENGLLKRKTVIYKYPEDKEIQDIVEASHDLKYVADDATYYHVYFSNQNSQENIIIKRK